MPVEIAIWVANYTLACNTALSLCRGTSILFKTLQPRISTNLSFPPAPLHLCSSMIYIHAPYLGPFLIPSPPFLPSQTHPFQPHPSNPISNTNQDRRQPYQKPTLPFLSFFLSRWPPGDKSFLIHIERYVRTPSSIRRLGFPSIAYPFRLPKSVPVHEREQQVEVGLGFHMTYKRSP